MDIVFKAILGLLALLLSLAVIMFSYLVYLVFKWSREKKVVQAEPSVQTTASPSSWKRSLKNFFKLAWLRAWGTYLIQKIKKVEWRRQVTLRSKILFRKISRSPGRRKMMKRLRVRSRLYRRRLNRNEHWQWFRSNKAVQVNAALLLALVITGGLWLDDAIWDSIDWLKLTYFNLYAKVPAITWRGVLWTLIALLALVWLGRAIYKGTWRNWSLPGSTGRSPYRYSASTQLLFLFLFILIFGLYVKDAGLMGEKKILALAESQAAGSNYLVISAAGAQRAEIRPIAFGEGRRHILIVEPKHRFDVVDTTGYRKTWTTYDRGVDSLGRRIQIFEVIAPAKEVKLEVAITKCLPSNCDW